MPSDHGPPPSVCEPKKTFSLYRLMVSGIWFSVEIWYAHSSHKVTEKKSILILMTMLQDENVSLCANKVEKEKRKA